MKYKKTENGNFMCNYLYQGHERTVIIVPSSDKAETFLMFCSCLKSILEAQIDEFHSLVEKVRQVYADASQGSFLYTEKRFPSAYWEFLSCHTAFHATFEPQLRIEAIGKIPKTIVPNNIYIDQSIREQCKALFQELKTGAEQLKTTIKKYQNEVTRTKSANRR